MTTATARPERGAGIDFQPGGYLDDWQIGQLLGVGDKRQLRRLDVERVVIRPALLAVRIAPDRWRIDEHLPELPQEPQEGQA